MQHNTFQPCRFLVLLLFVVAMPLMAWAQQIEVKGVVISDFKDFLNPHTKSFATTKA